MNNRATHTLQWPGIIAIACITIIVAVMVGGYWGMQQDDSYIYYSYARNLADGHGYVFNLGERVNATTSPLYTILLAVVYKTLGFIPFLTLPTIGRLISGISLFLLCYFLMRCFRRETNSLMWITLPLVLLCSPLLSDAFGMEMYLAMMLAVASLAMYVEEKYRSAALLASFAVLGRPDMLVVAGLLVIYYFVQKRRIPDLMTIALFVIPIVSWLIFSWFYFGALLPSTLAAKLAQTEAGLWGSGLLFLQGLFTGSNWYGGVLNQVATRILILLLFAVGGGMVIGLATTLIKFREWTVIRHPAFQILVLWGLLHLIAYGLVLNPPAYAWYYVPLVPMIAALMAVPLEAMREAAAQSPRLLVTGVAIVLSVVAVALPTASFGTKASWEYETHRQAALWLNDHAAEGASVGTGDIDILRYFYEKGPIIDGLGLINPKIAAHVRNRDVNWWILEYRPDYLMLTHESSSETDGMVAEDWFTERYDLQTVIGDPGEAVAIYARKR